MGYRSLRECIADLERTGQLVRIETEVDAHLEAAAIHRRVVQAGGPALLFSRVRNCCFPIASNLFGTLERTRFLFRDTWDAVRRLVKLKTDPGTFWKKPWQVRDVPRTLWRMRPKSVRIGPVLECSTRISDLPPVVHWPNDGGPFITMPEVYTEDVDRPGWRHSNLGMYRIQLAGNEYFADEEVGLHYQIHRGIGVHHAKAVQCGVPLRVVIAVGGPPALAFAAVMPLPEGMPEVAFAGALGGRRVRLTKQGNTTILADADFVIIGTVDPDRLKPEGPFGDHLGYYSLAHPFPVLRVESVHHRKDAIWPFTVVGRPPQEDTSFGQAIHELTGPVIPTVIPGLHAVHAVDAAGVHPLLLAIGSERYTPFAAERKPMELLTIANAILGQGQLSLAKYLWIAAKEDNPHLNIHDIPGFFRHMLERIDWSRDLHFQTCTTIDTLDYSGTSLNEGSKVVIAAAGVKRRELPTEIPSGRLPDGFLEPNVCIPGVLAIRGPAFSNGTQAMVKLCDELASNEAIGRFPVVVVVDDSKFTARTLNNWLWVTFTRSNPASDIHGVGALIENKHWGCRGSLVIDARIKPHHAPPLESDPAIEKKVDALGAPGGPLHGIV